MFAKTQIYLTNPQASTSTKRSVHHLSIGPKFKRVKIVLKLSLFVLVFGLALGLVLGLGLI